MPCCWRTAGSPSVAGCWSSGPRSVSSPRCWWCSGGGATVASCRTWSARGERCGRRGSRSGSCCTASIWTTDDALVSVPVVFHPATRLHNPGPGHPERPERIEAVLAALRAPDLTGTVERVEGRPARSEEHTSELQSRLHLVCRLLLEKKKMLLVETLCFPWTGFVSCVGPAAGPERVWRRTDAGPGKGTGIRAWMRNGWTPMCCRLTHA